MKKKQIGLFLGALGLLAFVFLSLNWRIESTLAAPTEPPEITDVESLDSYPDDGLMTIQVTNLDEEEKNHKVFLGESELSVREVRQSENELDVALSSALREGEITVFVNDVESINTFFISFPTPILNSISTPNGIKPEAEFYLHGSNFHPNPAENRIEVFSTNGRSVALEIIMGDENEIRAKFPEFPFDGSLAVSHKGWWSGTVSLNAEVHPQIDVLEYEGSYLEYDDTLTIHGRHFHEEFEENYIYFEDNDKDPETGILAFPFFVSADETEMKVKVPNGVKEGDLFVEIYDFDSNRLSYDLKPGPSIQFTNRSATLDEFGNVILSIQGNGFSSAVGSNVVYINESAATSLGMFGNSIIRANLGAPDPTGTIYVETGGYKGEEVAYDFSWLLLPNISSLETNNGFFPSKSVTFIGINFSDTTILTQGDDEGELTLSTSIVEPNRLVASISPEATIGQVITVQFRNGKYSGNTMSFTVGDPSKKITPPEPESEEEPEPEEEEEEEEPQIPFTKHFTDVIEGDWFANSVTQLVNRGIVQGRSDGNFHPGDPVTRAEFLKMTLLGANADLNSVSGQNFEDASGHWAANYMLYARTSGIVQANGHFFPDAKITRAEAIKILLNANGISTSGVIGEHFIDTLTHWSVLYAAKAFEEGVIEGELDEAGSRFFHPDRTMNRAEAAKIIFESIE